MNESYNPRQRRLNPRIREHVEILDEHWSRLISESDHLRRKGKLRIVRQTIDQLIEEPEWLEADLQEGPVNELRCRFGPDEFNGSPVPHFLGEDPFDAAGREEGRYFFYTATGWFSPLYDGEPIDPYYVGPLHCHGPWVYTLEKRYVTASETSMHVISDNVWRHLLGEPHDAPRDEAPERYLLLCDPRGVGGGVQALEIATFADPSEAVAIADRLAHQLDVRFLVALERMKHCTR